MSWHQTVVENLIDDLSYNPRRGALYLVLSLASLCVWYFEPPRRELDTIPLVFGLACPALLLKSVFFMRKTSSGLGATTPQLSLKEPQPSQPLGLPEERTQPSAPALIAQLVQDFGTGPLILAPILGYLKSLDESSPNLPTLPLLLIGAALFLAGWLLRRL